MNNPAPHASSLDQDLLELTSRARDYHARHRAAAALPWPRSVRIAVNFTADFDAMLLRRLLNEPPQQLAKGEFGGRVGIWRLIELFDSHTDQGHDLHARPHLRALSQLAARGGARAATRSPTTCGSIACRRSPSWSAITCAKTIAAIEKTVGKRPVGTRSTHSRELLLEHGYVYTSEDSPDHSPIFACDPDGSRPLLNLPMHFAIDDAMFFNFGWLASDNAGQRLMDPEHAEDVWWQAFLQQYEQGGYLNICLHPFVSGRAMRIAMLDRLIGRMKSKPGVWFATCEDVARHVLAAQPAA